MIVNFRNRFVYPKKIMAISSHTSGDIRPNFLAVKDNCFEFHVPCMHGNCQVIAISPEVVFQALKSRELLVQFGIVPVFEFHTSNDPDFTVTHEQYFFLPTTTKNVNTYVTLTQEQKQDPRILQAIHDRHVRLQAFGVKIYPIQELDLQQITVDTTKAVGF